MSVAANVARQYYIYNASFNASRAVYISTYSLFLTQVLGFPISWAPWLLAANLVSTMMAEVPTGAYGISLGGTRVSRLHAQQPA